MRELVGWKPEAFELEKNVGRRTVRETREVIESLLGCSWEEATVTLDAGTPAVNALADGSFGCMSELRAEIVFVEVDDTLVRAHNHARRPASG